MPASPHDGYASPLAGRYASEKMQRLWSARHKFTLWRRIWLAAAKAQHEVTKDRETPLVTAEQIAELEANLDVTDHDLERAAHYEKELRHDVMAHVHAWGERCPKAKGIIHLGMTSQDINDNCELMLLTEAITLHDRAMNRLMVALGDLAGRYMSVPTLAFTHYQPAQPTTFGRRVATWAHDLRWCERSSGFVIEQEHLVLRGFRGATGTQASFLALFDNDTDLVRRFEAHAVLGMLPNPVTPPAGMHRQTRQEAIERIERVLLRNGSVDGFQAQSDVYRERLAEYESMTDEEWRARSEQFHIDNNTFALVNQTYPRVFDINVITSLASACAVLHKMATDLRLLCNRKEIDEPFEQNQIGSSAMPYKRNPMRCERVCGLARFVMNLVGNTYETAATQWLERTLDDSANRRLTLPEAFLATDACLSIMHNVISGLVVHEAQVKKNLMAELPFLATENILMAAVKAGGDRQELHEVIRAHAQEVAWHIKQEGGENDLIERLRSDPHFASVKDRLTEGDLLDPMQYVGRSVEQTERFIAEVIEPLREGLDEGAEEAEELRV